MTNPFSAAALDIDPATACTEIEAAIRHQVLHTLHRRGVVLGLSGGIDSSVVANLCARALGADRVFALCMPEQDSAPESLELALDDGRDAWRGFRDRIHHPYADCGGLLSSPG